MRTAALQLQAARLISQAECESPQQGPERGEHVDARKPGANAVAMPIRVGHETLDLHVRMHANAVVRHAIFWEWAGSVGSVLRSGRPWTAGGRAWAVCWATGLLVRMHDVQERAPTLLALRAALPLAGASGASSGAAANSQPGSSQRSWSGTMVRVCPPSMSMRRH
jgi:hypothetical protein